MIKNFLFYFATGLAVSYFYTKTIDHISIVLGIVAGLVAFISLYIGKLSDKYGTQKLYYFSVPLVIISLLLLSSLFFQILYGISSSIILLLINIETSNRQETSGKKFGKLNFYAQLASASSILLGGIVSSNLVVILYCILLVIFLFYESIFSKNINSYIL